MDINKSIHISLLLEIYGNLLTIKQKQILTDFYDNNMSLGEIAENTSTSRQAVSDIIKRSQKILENYESKLLLLKKFNKIKNDITAIKNLITNNGDKNSINARLDNILEEI